MSGADFKISALAHTFGYRNQELGEKITQPGLFPFITISRQTGAGGHALGKRIIELLNESTGDPELRGWKLYDQEICKIVAEDQKLRVSLSELFAEEYHTLLDDLMAEMILGYTSHDRLMPRMFRVIYELASMGKAVIIGRGSSFLTGDLPNGLHIRLVAPLSNRALRMQEVSGMSEDGAEQLVRKLDRDRSRLVKNYFHADIEDPLNYDMIFNTEKQSIDEIAAVVTQVLRSRARQMSLV